jgi:ABC-2 type transport system permease protein
MDRLRESPLVRFGLVSEAEARQLLADDEIYAAVLLPPGFSDRLRNGEPATARFLFADFNAAQRVQQEVEAVMSRTSATAGAAQVALQTATELASLTEGEREALLSSALESAGAELERPPVAIRVETATSLEGTGQWANFTGPRQSSPGMVVMFGMTTMLGVAVVLVQERRMGTLRRLLITPASRGSILAGKFVGALWLGLAQTAVLTLFGQLAFDVPYGNDPLALAVVVLAFSLAIVSMGLFFATLMRTEEQAGNTMVGVSMAMAALGGAWWPIAITPSFMQTLGHLFPSAWAMDAFQAIILRGGTLAEVWQESVILLAYAAAFFALAVWRLRFE